MQSEETPSRMLSSDAAANPSGTVSLGFLLAGNGPHLNRGCEAIVRGTVRILDAAVGAEPYYELLVSAERVEVEAQWAGESDPRLAHHYLEPVGRLSVGYVKYQLRKRLGLGFPFEVYRLPSAVYGCAAALQVGGDNYTLDYGHAPVPFLRLDEQLLRAGLPLVMWGATVGPFDKDPEVEDLFANHLKRFLVIYAREHRTVKYLLRLGLENVVQVADPAFLMEPEPIELSLPENYIGLNFSPLTAKHAMGGDIEAWARVCGEATRAAARRTGLPILLIPHVFVDTDIGNDARFLTSVSHYADMKHQVHTVAGEALNAPQLKWIISRAIVFAGARTHATIAAMSTCVPTLSLAYSEKAWGISEDVFGHSDFCLSVENLPENIGGLAEGLMDLLRQRETVRKQLEGIGPSCRANALKAGIDLKEQLIRLGRIDPTVAAKGLSSVGAS
jgi:polysaccharide pyruvyl transferase WcaK-like protein